ncbi:MAG: hypothetical protein M1533_03315 [Candidatus Thermoplasmatota archaeon]|jgi:hypothetical protein|nr:hypothetical protein [Candidatus Thermoplasmatota archaeon]MCL5794076.1 hypothetical protein [Candidatus Thermoplasmatota archaeon]
MKFFRKKDVTDLSPEQADERIVQIETQVSLLGKERDRKKAEFDKLFKEGASASGTRRADIAHELSRLERSIKDLDKRMKIYRDNIDIIEEVKLAKSQTKEAGSDIIMNANPEDIKDIMIKNRSREKVNDRKRGELLQGISDVKSTEEESTSESENKFMKLFSEMDKNKENLLPGSKEKSTQSEESEKSQEKEE